MPVEIVGKPLFYPKLSTQPIPYSLFNIRDRGRFELTIKVSTWFAVTENAPVTVNSTDYVGDYWIVDPLSRFKDFTVGDTIRYYDGSTNQSFTIQEKTPDNMAIRVDSIVKNKGASANMAPNATVDNAKISVSTRITALSYRYNFIENSDLINFISRTTGTIQELTAKGISGSNPTPKAMVFTGAKGYQTGSATVEGVSISAPTDQVYSTVFLIKHTTAITPFFLADQYVNFIRSVAPNDYFGGNCVRYIYDISAAVAFNNPNWIQFLPPIYDVGNTGWLGENFNSGNTNYVIENPEFKNAAGDVISAAELTDQETSLTFTVRNDADAPFSNNNTKFELGFMKVPFSDVEYQLNALTYDENFMDDRAVQTVGAAAVNGEQFGISTRQVLKNVQATFISASEIFVSCKLAMTPTVVEKLNESQEPRYLIDFSVQNHTLASEDADLVRLPVAKGPLFINYLNKTRVKIDTVYYRHWENGLITEGTQFPVIGPEDEGDNYAQIILDRAEPDGDKINIVRMVASMVALNAVTGESFELDRFQYEMAGAPIINGNQFVQEIDTLPRPFLIPTSEKTRKYIQILRREDLDEPNKFFYGFNFPFLARWEYWVLLSGVNGFFHDTQQPQNGQNQNWFRYSVPADWKVYFRFEVVTEKNGVEQADIKLMKFDFFTYNKNPDWKPSTGKLYTIDPVTGLKDIELTDGIDGILVDNIDVIFEARFENTVGTPVLADHYVNIHIEQWESGGISGTRRMSSLYKSPNDWLTSIDGSDKTIVTLDGNAIVAQVKILAGALPNFYAYGLEARLYQKKPQIECICPIGWQADYLNHRCFRYVDEELETMDCGVISPIVCDLRVSLTRIVCIGCICPVDYHHNDIIDACVSNDGTYEKTFDF